MSTLQPTPRWSRFEASFASSSAYDNPLQEVDLLVTFIAPSGALHTVRGFWDGDLTWRVRFLPDEIGRWTYRTACSDDANVGLHQITNWFDCTEPTGATPCEQHGPVRVAADGRHLAHADGTPFFWLADTGWNGPLLSTDDEWAHYLAVRVEQKFSAVQWVPTQWIAAPEGDRHGRRPFTGHDRIAVDPAVFQRLDRKLDAINAAGLLGAPVLLWAAEWGAPEVMAVNPGLTLPEGQCILLARYMVARWGGNAVAWILPGDGEYTGAKAARWQRIGRAVFGQIDHAPVTLHPCGLQWYGTEFRAEGWLDFIGYQSCHFGRRRGAGVVGTGTARHRLAGRTGAPDHQPGAELRGHSGPGSPRPHLHRLRRPTRPYWSLLVSPTAGVTYGAQGVWGWDDGSGPPAAHETFGAAPAWQEAIHLPGARQIAHLADFFAGLPWWQLRPAPSLVAEQPGDSEIGRFVAAALSQDGNVAVVYIPGDHSVTLSFAGRRPLTAAWWLNPRTGERSAAEPIPVGEHHRFDTPAAGDWLLLCTF